VCRYIIEIKPAKQCVEPRKKPGKVTKTFIREATTYAINQAKWNAASEYAKDNGIEFKVLTEVDLGIPAPKRRKRN
jgi:hypothetical protein